MKGAQARAHQQRLTILGFNTTKQNTNSTQFSVDSSSQAHEMQLSISADQA
jgi:hypothetical protein